MRGPQRGEVWPWRLLVCGSRDWTDEERVVSTLDAVMDGWWMAKGITVDDVALIHGHCKTGADAMAERWALRVGIAVERHPAEWIRYGKAAGPRRNEEMAALGAHRCVAFMKGDSPGTTNMVTLALARTIMVTLVRG